MNYNNPPMGQGGSSYTFSADPSTQKDSTQKDSKLSALLVRLEEVLVILDFTNARLGTVVDKADGPRVTNEEKTDKVPPSSPATLSRLESVIYQLENVSSRLAGNTSDLEILI